MNRRLLCFPPQQTIDAWRLVFLTAAGVTVACNLVFVALGSGELQPWNEIGDRESGKE